MNPKLRADADLYRIKDGCWWGVYHEYRGDKASPPVKKLTDWLGAPKIELHRLRLEKKAELAEELGLKEARQFNLESMTNQYLTFKEKEGVKRSYLIYIKRSLRFLMDACGNFDLRNWNQVKEEVFLDFLKDRGVTGTAHQRHVQGFLNWIHNKRKIEGFHYWRITKGKEPDFEIQIFTPEEITEYKRLIFLHPNLTWRRAWMLAYYCFMRAGEIWSLRTQDIILDGHRPHVFITDVDDVKTNAFPTGWTPKAHIKRRVGIHKDLAEFLKKDLNNNPRFWYLEKNTKRAQKLPPNSVGRMAFSDPHGLSVAFMRLRDQQFKWPKKIDFLHALRRTAITRHVEAGTPKEDLRYLCGHKEEKTTTKYYIWVDKQKALEKVNIDL